MVEEKMIQRIEEIQGRIQAQIEADTYPHKDHRSAFNVDLAFHGSSPEAPVIFG